MTKENHQFSSEFQISASDSFESKSRLLDVNASLKASLFGGLIEVGGSAEYLNDNKESHNQCRVTFQYKATTSFKELFVMTPQTKKTQKVDSVVKGVATHVVTGILYGVNAFFVFDSEKVDSSSVEDLQGQMEAVIHLIPSFNIDGKVDIKLSEEQKRLADTFSCTFYGDLLLKSNPTSFSDAMNIYAELPSLLGKNYENVVPLQVWLMPLKNFDSQAAEVKNSISVGVVRRAEEILEDVKEMKTRCKDSLQDTTVNTFPQINKQLSSFYDLCNYYAAAIQLVIKKDLPLIRAGEEEETCIREKLEERHKSPFSQEELSEWMENKEREINVIRSCAEIMKGVKIIPDQSELDRNVLAPGAEVFCFVFTSLETSDPYLQKMAEYVDSFKIQNVEFDRNNKAACLQEPWYNKNEVITKMREKATGFFHLSETHKSETGKSFFIAAIANESYEGASIYHYQNGTLVSDDH